MAWEFLTLWSKMAYDGILLENMMADIKTEPRKLQNLWQRGTDFLGCRLAIMGGAMSWVSERKLVSALSNSGAFGVLACGSMSPDLLEKEIIGTRALTDKPFGVNLIIMHPEINKLLEICGKHKVSHIVLAGGIPKSHTIETAKSSGAKLMCFAPAIPVARKLIKLGADAIVIEGMEAGGHIGPVSTSVLAQEILPEIREVPVFVAGGIGRGEAIASYLEMGASGVQLGTRFVCSEESIAHAKFKQVLIHSNARNAVASIQVDEEFQVIPVRAIENHATKEFVRLQHEVIKCYRAGELDKTAATLQIEHFWAGALRRAVIDGDVEHGSLMAGQSVGMVTRIESVRDILGELMAQAENYLSHNCREK